MPRSRRRIAGCASTRSASARRRAASSTPSCRAAVHRPRAGGRRRVRLRRRLRRRRRRVPARHRRGHAARGRRLDRRQYYPAESAGELQQVFRGLPTTPITRPSRSSSASGSWASGGLLAASRCSSAGPGARCPERCRRRRGVAKRRPPAARRGSGAFEAASRIWRSASSTPPSRRPRGRAGPSAASGRRAAERRERRGRVERERRQPRAGLAGQHAARRHAIAQEQRARPTATWIATLPGVWPGSGITCGEPGRSSVASPSTSSSVRDRLRAQAALAQAVGHEPEDRAGLHRAPALDGFLTSPRARAASAAWT